MPLHVWTAGAARRMFLPVQRLIPHHAFQSHLTLANLGIDGDSFGVHIQWQPWAGLWRAWERTTERRQPEKSIQLTRFEPIDSSNHCQSWRVVAPGRSRSWRLFSDTGCPLWPLLLVGPDTCFPSVSRSTLCFAPLSILYLGSIIPQCASHCGQREGHLAERLSHSTGL